MFCFAKIEIAGAVTTENSINLVRFIAIALEVIALASGERKISEKPVHKNNYKYAQGETEVILF